MADIDVEAEVPGLSGWTPAEWSEFCRRASEASDARLRAAYPWPKDVVLARIPYFEGPDAAERDYLRQCERMRERNR